MSAFASTPASLSARAVARLRSLFAVREPEPLDYPFAPSDVAQLQRITGAAPAIDDQTWSDLLLDAYLSGLSRQLGLCGQQVLCQRLREGQGDADCAAQGERLRMLMRDPAELEQLHALCRPLRRADTDIAVLLFDGAHPATPRWVAWDWLLPVGLFASVAAVALSPLAWLGAGFFLFQLISIQMGHAERMERSGRTMHAIQMLLRACSLLGAHPHPLLREAAAAAGQAGRINRALGRSPQGMAIPGLRLYADWFLLANVNHYYKSEALVAANLDFLRGCYTACANIEADIALARHLPGAGQTCWAERGDERQLNLDRVVHPLLEHAAPLDIALDGTGAFISGQNGIGKSTLLRTVGLNLVVARAFGFCYARRALAPALMVYASMRGEDSLAGGESLYMAELRRAGELLAASEGARRAIYIIDEIFRGTNHLESVSAAAAVLDQLAARGMVIVSSHNLVLAALLAHRLAPWCVRAGDGAGERLVLAPGVLAHTNGIALLRARGFGEEVEGKAARVFEWLDGYLADPGHCGHVLGPPISPA